MVVAIDLLYAVASGRWAGLPAGALDAAGVSSDGICSDTLREAADRFLAEFRVLERGDPGFAGRWRAACSEALGNYGERDAVAPVTGRVPGWRLLDGDNLLHVLCRLGRFTELQHRMAKHPELLVEMNARGETPPVLLCEQLESLQHQYMVVELRGRQVVEAVLSATQDTVGPLSGDTTDFQRRLFDCTVALAGLASVKGGGAGKLWHLAVRQLQSVPLDSRPTTQGIVWPAGPFLSVVVEHSLHSVNEDSTVQEVFLELLDHSLRCVPSLALLECPLLRAGLPGFLVNESTPPVREAFQRWFDRGVEEEFWAWPCLEGYRLPTPVHAVLTRASAYETRQGFALDQEAEEELLSKTTAGLSMHNRILKHHVRELPSGTLMRLRGPQFGVRVASCGLLRSTHGLPTSRTDDPSPPFDSDFSAALVSASLHGGLRRHERLSRAMNLLSGLEWPLPSLVRLVAFELVPDVLDPAYSGEAADLMLRVVKQWRIPIVPPSVVSSLPQIQYYRDMNRELFRGVIRFVDAAHAAHCSVPVELVISLVEAGHLGLAWQVLVREPSKLCGGAQACRRLVNVAIGALQKCAGNLGPQMDYRSTCTLSACRVCGRGGPGLEDSFTLSAMEQQCGQVQQGMQKEQTLEDPVSTLGLGAGTQGGAAAGEQEEEITAFSISIKLLAFLAANEPLEHVSMMFQLCVSAGFISGSHYLFHILAKRNPVSLCAHFSEVLRKSSSTPGMLKLAVCLVRDAKSLHPLVKRNCLIEAMEVGNVGLWRDLVSLFQSQHPGPGTQGDWRHWTVLRACVKADLQHAFLSEQEQEGLMDELSVFFGSDGRKTLPSHILPSTQAALRIGCLPHKQLIWWLLDEACSDTTPGALPCSQRQGRLQSPFSSASGLHSCVCLATAALLLSQGGGKKDPPSRQVCLLIESTKKLGSANQTTVAPPAEDTRVPSPNPARTESQCLLVGWLPDALSKPTHHLYRVWNDPEFLRSLVSTALLARALSDRRNDIIHKCVLLPWMRRNGLRIVPDRMYREILSYFPRFAGGDEAGTHELLECYNSREQHWQQRKMGGFGSSTARESGANDGGGGGGGRRRGRSTMMGGLIGWLASMRVVNGERRW